jgi:hypothetical protein
MARSSGLPLVWANPLKYVRDPDRLILLHALEKKMPFSSGERRSSAAAFVSSGPGRRLSPCAGSAMRPAKRWRGRP